MNKTSNCLWSAAVLAFSSQLVDAAFVLNFNENYGTATVADFQVADAALDAGADLFNINGEDDFNAARGAGALTSGGLTIETTGAPQNDGFDTGLGLSPIVEGNLYKTGGNLGLTITGLSSVTSGQTVVLTAWGIGDSANQDTAFTGTYGADDQSGNTTFSSSPYVQFTFTADGSTDTLTLVAAPGTGGQNRSHFSGVSLSVVPEPSSSALLGLGGLALILRRRK